MNITRMSYPQYRKARKLTHECCNYCNGNCLLLDDGEECVCVQSISYSLLCRWFKVAVLPLDAALCAEITKGRDEIKRCAVCGAAFTPNSNRAKYCPDCAVQVRRKKEAERQRKRYLLSTHLYRGGWVVRSFRRVKSMSYFLAQGLNKPMLASVISMLDRAEPSFLSCRKLCWP